MRNKYNVCVCWPPTRLFFSAHLAAMLTEVSCFWSAYVLLVFSSRDWSRILRSHRPSRHRSPQIDCYLSSQLLNKSNKSATRETNIPECPKRRGRLEAGVTCVGGHLKVESRSDTLADGVHNQSYIIQKNNTLLLCPPTPPLPLCHPFPPLVVPPSSLSLNHPLSWDGWLEDPHCHHDESCSVWS